MKVVATKTGGYVVFTTATSGVVDAIVRVYGRYEVGSSSGTNNGLKFSVWGTDDANDLFDLDGSAVSGKNTKTRFYASRPSWIPSTSVFNSAAVPISWNEMENGDLVSKTLLTNDGGITLKSRNVGLKPEDSVVIDGKTYTLRFIELGYLSSAGDTSLTSKNEFMKYIYGSRNSKANGGIDPAWGTINNLVDPYNVDVPNSAYGIPYYNKSSISTGAVAGVYKQTSNEIYGSGTLRTIIIAHAAATKPWIEAIPSNFGEHSKGFSLVSSVSYDKGGNISWNIKNGDSTVASANNVSPSSPISITTEQLTGMGLGKKTLTVTVTGAGGSNSYKTAVTVTTNMIDVQGNPIECDKMPVICSVVNIVVVGSGATQKWYVTNNANDTAPIWEEYNGGEHEFVNKNKSSDKWAVSWRCQIVGASATTKSELKKKVGMAVTYGENN